MTLSEATETKFYVIEYKPTINSPWKQIDYRRATYEQLCSYIKKEYGATPSGYRHDMNGGYIEYFKRDEIERFKAYEERNKDFH